MMLTSAACGDSEGALATVWRWCNGVPLIKGASLSEMQSDCSGKRHYRALTSTGKSYVLLDSSYSREAARSFVAINNFMYDASFSVPKIYHHSDELQLILIEDFGSDSYKAILESEPYRAMELYINAVTVLIKIAHLRKLPTLPAHNTKILHSSLEQNFFQKYAAYFLQDHQLKEAATDLANIFDTLYRPINLNQGMVLRDYHIENLMLLHARKDYKKVGLLDIQDAAIGNIAYDLVSLLEDARHDVPQEVVLRAKQYFFSALPHVDSNDLEYSYKVLGMQRNMRILGLFYDLSKKPDKEKYTQFLPRVSGYIKSALQDNIFIALQRWSDTYKVPLYIA